MGEIGKVKRPLSELLSTAEGIVHELLHEGVCVRTESAGAALPYGKRLNGLTYRRPAN